MRSYILTGILFVTPCLAAPAGASPATAVDARANAAVSRQIESLEAQLREASLRGDAQFFERTLADDFSHTGPSGETLTKAETIGDYKSKALTYETLDRGDVSIRVFGDTAVVTERDLMKGSFRNHYFSGRYRVTRVWVRSRNRWQVVTSQSTFFVEPPEADEGTPAAGRRP